MNLYIPICARCLTAIGKLSASALLYDAAHARHYIYLNDKLYTNS